jgi:hypothetical protein
MNFVRFYVENFLSFIIVPFHFAVLVCEI